MPETTTVPGRRERLTTPQTLHLMRLEVERALRHGYPICCMMLALDGFLASELLLCRKVVMPLVFRELKAVTFERDVRGLGVWTEGFQLAVFPHLQPEDVLELAEELRGRSRALRHADVPASEPIELSIGISHNLHKGSLSFETLVEDAEAGLSMAQAAGGGRVVRWRETEREVDRLRRELDAQLREIEDVQERIFGSRQSEESAWGQGLVTRVLELFQHEPDQSEGVVRLENEVIALLKAELAEWGRTSTAGLLIESQRQIELLERRVAKLTESLGMTEAELQRIARLKNVDAGLASIYRSVQGLSSSDDQYEAKQDMLKNIFEANLALRAEMGAKT